MNLSRYTLLDLETVALDDAAQWLPAVSPDGRLTDSVKIANDLANKIATLLDAAPLDPDLCRIVACGVEEHDGTRWTTLSRSDHDERHILEDVWQSVNATTPMLGYGLTFFDAGVLVRRSQLLGVQVPTGFYRQGKYRHDWIVELADYLTLNGMIEQKKGRGLDYHCRRLGIQVEDAHSGKDVAQLWKDGNTEAILTHCTADLMRIRLLAERLGVIQPVPAEVGVF